MRYKCFLWILLFPALCQGQLLKEFQQSPEGIAIFLKEGTLRICPLTNNAVRIKFIKDRVVPLPELILTELVNTPVFKTFTTPLKIEVQVNRMKISFNKQTETLTFADHEGKIFLSEKEASRKLLSDTVLGEPCYVAEQVFESPADESLFGLGQFQDGHYNLKNVSRRLTQVNSQISIPFVYSSKGYGLLWHQYGLTDFNPADTFIHLEKQEQPTTGNSLVAEVTTTSGTQKIAQNQAFYSGKFKVPEDGRYSLFLDLGDMGNRQYVVLDGKPCIDQSNMWLPPTVSASVDLKAGEHQLQLVCKSNNTPTVSWRRHDNRTTFRSPNAKALDFVVFYGPSADSVIATYRNLSGNVPMLPLWAYGFWQCRERYSSGTHLVETVKEFRKRNIPMDVIVQDWQYWGKYGWGVMKFDEANYQDPSGFIGELHHLNAHFSISVWENLSKESEIGKDYVAKKLFIPNSPWVDVFNPLAQQTHWNALNQNLFVHGVDSWWMDATEPENDGLKGKLTFLGLGDFYRLTYPLFVSKAVYEGQRKTSADKRVCILTRSAFPGQQRYGIINWSGDIGGTWDSYQRQIVAGLNFTITGFPYWTTDIGGFFRPGKSQYTDEKYQELLTRWFQWGALNPIFRVHGYMSETEPWKYGQQVEDNMRKMLDLRYRLLPYIYSEAWQVTKNGSTIMRPLVMDFNGDSSAIQQRYEYMFGKSILAVPITEPGVTQWKVYLPKGTAWYDFWTGERYDGGMEMKTASPLDKMPLYVKAGTILPLGKFVQYAGEKSSDTLEIRIYKGADGKFELYEDEGDSYNYEQGRYTLIPMIWEDHHQVLTIGPKLGNFPKCIQKRIFKLVIVSNSDGFGMLYSSSRRLIPYFGEKLTVKIK